MLNYAAMDFSKLEIRIDFGIDRNEIIFTAQEIEEGTKVTVHSVVSSVPVDLCVSVVIKAFTTETPRSTEPQREANSCSQSFSGSHYLDQVQRQG